MKTGFDYCQIGFMAEFNCDNGCAYCDPNGRRKKEQKSWISDIGYTNWQKAFKKIEKPFYLLITGGEPLNNDKMSVLINYVAGLKNCLGIRVDTNGKFAGNLRKCASDKININLSYHSHKTTYKEFSEIVETIQKRGYNVAMINFVLHDLNFNAIKEENFAKDCKNNEELFDVLSDKIYEDYKIKINPQLNYNGYTEEHYKIAGKYMDDVDLYFKSGKPAKGKLFYGNMVNYSLNYDGMVSVLKSTGNTLTNFIKDGLPELDSEPVIYPDNKSFCLHSYIYFEEVINKKKCTPDSLKGYINRLKRPDR